MIQVHIVCAAPLLLEAWASLVAAQPQLSVAGAFAELPASSDSSADESAAIFWAAADQHRESPLSEHNNLTRRAGVLCLFADYEQTTIIRFLQAGFTGFITPQATVAELATALIATSRQEIVLPPAIASQTLAALARGMVAPGGQADPDPDELTERESEILTCSSIQVCR